MCKRMEHTIFCCNEVVAVSVQILVCVFGLSVESGDEGEVGFWRNQGVQEW